MQELPEEVPLLSEEQWERIISWHRKRSGKEIVEELISAKQLSDALERIQRLVGHTQEKYDEVSQALLNMANEG